MTLIGTLTTLGELLLFGTGAWLLGRRNATTRTPAPPLPAAGTAPGQTLARATPPPGPALTKRELRRLGNLDAWAQTSCDPVRRQSAEMLADTFRSAFPWISDDDLGRVLLQVAETALAYGTNGAGGRLPGTLGLAAAELTRLTRTDVHLDQH